MVARLWVVSTPEASIPRWVRRLLWRVGVLVAALYVARGVLADLKSLLVMMLVSLFLAFAMEPAVDRLERRGWRRGSATGLIMGGVTIGVLAFITVMGTLLIDQVRTLAENAPDYVDEVVTWINDTFDAELDAQDLQDSIREADLPSRLASQGLSVTTRVLGGLLNALTIGLFTFYLVADGPRLRRSICGVLPPDRQREVLAVWEVAISKTGGYLSSRVLLALLSGLFHGVAFSIIGVPSSVALGVWVGLVSQFLPVVGTYLAGVLPILIAVVDSPSKALWVLGTVVVYQQIENYLFAPRITARTLEIHPAVAFGSVLAGAAVLGTAGALLALPAAASIQAVAGTYVTRHALVESVMLETPPRRPRRKRMASRSSGG